MIPPETGERRAGGLKANLIERLHDPLQLRILLIGLVLAAGYGGIYMPLAAQIAETTAKLGRERKRAELARSLEQLQAQYRSFAKRLPRQADGKEWMQYMYEGIRKFPLKPCRLDCPPPKRLGPYQTVILEIQLEGSLFDLDQFLRWLESNPRLFRVDEISIAPVKTKQQGKGKGEPDLDNMAMKLTVLGLAG
jgi:Tfp pilus assembly protein PilO